MKEVTVEFYIWDSEERNWDWISYNLWTKKWELNIEWVKERILKDVSDKIDEFLII